MRLTAIVLILFGLFLLLLCLAAASGHPHTTSMGPAIIPIYLLAGIGCAWGGIKIFLRRK
jgi:hypothetical protein